MTDNTRAITPQDFRFNPPRFDDGALAEFARERFGVGGAIRYLWGERDQNRLFETGPDEGYVLKVSGPLEDPLVVQFQIEALLHIERTAPALPVPRIIPTLSGASADILKDDEGVAHVARLVSYLPGLTFESASRVPLHALEAIGRFQGELCAVLGDFSHPGADHFMPWDISNGLVASKDLWEYAGPDLRAAVGEGRAYLAERVIPKMGSLRAQVIHNDSHRGNLIRGTPDSFDVSGLIDFGDMVRAPLIQDLAVSAASFIRVSATPIEAVTALASGFHEFHALESDEVEALHGLILARLVLAGLLYDFMIAECPGHVAYGTSDRSAVLDQITRWVSIHPEFLADRVHAVLELKGTRT